MGNAKSFLKTVESNPELQNQLNAVDWDTQKVVGIAAHAGFSFNAGELQTAIDDLWGNLSEADLRKVQGAGGPSNPLGKDANGTDPRGKDNN